MPDNRGPSDGTGFTRPVARRRIGASIAMLTGFIGTAMLVSGRDVSSCVYSVCNRHRIPPLGKGGNKVGYTRMLHRRRANQ